MGSLAIFHCVAGLFRAGKGIFLLHVLGCKGGAGILSFIISLFGSTFLSPFFFSLFCFHEVEKSMKAVGNVGREGPVLGINF